MKVFYRKGDDVVEALSDGLADYYRSRGWDVTVIYPVNDPKYVPGEAEPPSDMDELIYDLDAEPTKKKAK